MILLRNTDYNKSKMICETIVQNYRDKLKTVILRPATVCGYAPRLRLDLSVNILTNHAITNNLIKVFGGDQLRPNLHVKDYCSAKIKKQWGQNMTKFQNVQMPGGVTLNGEMIYNDAVEELKILDESLRNTWETPPLDMIG